MNKNGFIDADFNWLAFAILAGLAILATLVGFRVSGEFAASWSGWQKVVIIVGEVIAAFVVTYVMSE